MVFRLRDEPEQFRAGIITEIINDYGVRRLKVEGIRDINQNRIYHADEMISDSESDIDWAKPGYYTAEHISFVHLIKEERKIP